MTKLVDNIVKFAAGDQQTIALFESFKDYWNQYRSDNGTKKYPYSSVDSKGATISFSEKEDLLNAAMKREIGKRAGVDFTSMPLEQLVSHPMVAWATFAIVSQLIESVMPDTLQDSIGFYTDIRTAGYGDSFKFDVKPRDLFAVSKSGRLGMREAEVKKQFDGEVTVVPEMRQISVGVSLYRVLSGQESLSIFVAKAIKSIETQMNLDVYNAFATAMAALSTTPTTSALQVSGWSSVTFAKLAQRISAWSGGAKPVALGTKAALSSVLPDDANYRYQLNDPFFTLGYVKQAMGVDIIELPQVADWSTPFAVTLSDSYIWLVAPGTDKLIKLCLEGSTMANTSGVFDNATLTQNATIWKSWKAAVVTSSVAGCIAL